LLQSQTNYIHVHAEKNTVSAQIEHLCMKYTLPLSSGRGFRSSKPRNDLVQRFRKSGKDRLVLLIVSDLDPAGMAIAESYARSIRDDFGMDDVLALKVSITMEQVEQFHLPHGGKAKKVNPGLRAELARRYGEYVYEVEALPASAEAAAGRSD
jgi:hypothetical protein